MVDWDEYVLSRLHLDALLKVRHELLGLFEPVSDVLLDVVELLVNARFDLAELLELGVVERLLWSDGVVGDGVMG